MSENNIVKSLAITLMLFQIIFPIFVFGFTVFNPESYDIGNIDITLDMDALASAQVFFSEAKTEELTHGSYVQYDLNESKKKMRVSWDEYAIVNPITQFRFTKQNIIELKTDTWLWPQKLTVKIGGVTYNPTPPDLDYARNQTIINAFNPEYNWTREPGSKWIKIIRTQGDRRYLGPLPDGVRFARRALTYTPWVAPDLKKTGVSKPDVQDDFSCKLDQDLYDVYQPRREFYANLVQERMWGAMKEKMKEEEAGEKALFGEAVNRELDALK